MLLVVGHAAPATVATEDGGGAVDFEGLGGLAAHEALAAGVGRVDQLVLRVVEDDVVVVGGHVAVVDLRVVLKGLLDGDPVGTDGNEDDEEADADDREDEQQLDEGEIAAHGVS